MKIKWSVPSVRGWPFAAICALVLGVLVLIDRGSVNSDVVRATCRVEVTAEVLTERVEPEPTARAVKDLHRGDVLGAETTVQGGYRKLADGYWALDDYLRPLPGSRCLAL